MLSHKDFANYKDLTLSEDVPYCSTKHLWFYVSISSISELFGSDTVTAGKAIDLHSFSERPTNFGFLYL
jgi:hypothetical protein